MPSLDASTFRELTKRLAKETKQNKKPDSIQQVDFHTT